MLIIGMNSRLIFFSSLVSGWLVVFMLCSSMNMVFLLLVLLGWILVFISKVGLVECFRLVVDLLVLVEVVISSIG